jgi:hypothetical protein
MGDLGNDLTRQGVVVHHMEAAAVGPEMVRDGRRGM